MTIEEAELHGIREILNERNVLLSHAIYFIEKQSTNEGNDFLHKHRELIEKFEKEYGNQRSTFIPL